MLKIRRAIISVWDKKGILELAKKLAEHKIEIISTGKTAQLLKSHNIMVTAVSSIIDFPEILSGRVKTLHPNIFGGILANKKHPLHMDEIKNLNIQPIDLVVVNLYPFQEKLNEKLPIDEMVEYIDIGGTAMLRAAAKNYKNVACLHDCGQYKKIMDELDKNSGCVSEETLLELAVSAFSATKQYEATIYNYFSKEETSTCDMVKISSLRYGENPHQKAALYKFLNQPVLNFKQLQGKELSYNNFMDMDAAFRLAKEFNEPVAVIVKHLTPCGVGVDKNITKAYQKAYAVDPLSAFGGIVAINRKVDQATAKAMVKEFKECVIAPGFSQEAIRIFSEKKNLRVIEVDFSASAEFKDIRATVFGYLVQDQDTVVLDKNKLKTVTKKKATARELKDMMIAWKIVKHVKSNAIVLVRNGVVVGIGSGQPSRVGSVKIALASAGQAAKGAVLASEAFFPKEDSIRQLYAKGVRSIIQPGGSIKDQDIIDLCDKLKVNMVFTGIRHFRH